MDYFEYRPEGNENSISNNNPPDMLSIASLVCGILSVICCCSGVFSIPLGALGIIFAILTRRIGKSMSTMSIAGIWLSCVGLALGVLITISAFVTAFSDPLFYEQLDAAFEQTYGMDFEEYCETYLY